MMSATPIPSNPCSRNSVPATSRIFSRFAADCSRVTLTAAPFVQKPLDSIHDDHHIYTFMTTIMKTGTAAVLLAVVAIGFAATRRGRAATRPADPPPPEVSVITVTGENVAAYREYPARTYARDLVEVRGRVDG